MDRTAHETGRSRRFITGVTLATAATVLMLATVYASSGNRGDAKGLTFPNPSGVIETIGFGETDADNPFFQELGTNGRTCGTCHRPAQGWSITPAEDRKSVV